MAATPRLMIAATQSGAGVSSVIGALLLCLLNKGQEPVYFQQGPDLQRSHLNVLAPEHVGCNLDLFLADDGTVRGLLESYTEKGTMALIEAAAPYYDGLNEQSDELSAFDVARVTDTPVILLLEAQSTLTLTAVIEGVKNFRNPQQIAGIILNRCHEDRYEQLLPVLETQSIPILGFIPERSSFGWDARYELDEKGIEALKAMAQQMQETVAIDEIVRMARSANPLQENIEDWSNVKDRTVTKQLMIAVPFVWGESFYYRENIDFLAFTGAKIVRFDPLEEAFPEDISGIYLPDMREDDLLLLDSTLRTWQDLQDEEMPCLAFGSGARILQSMLEGNPLELREEGAPSYMTLTARRDSSFSVIGESYRAFGRTLAEEDGDFEYYKPQSSMRWYAGYTQGKKLASEGQMYFPGSHALPLRFLRMAEAYAKNRRTQS